MITDPVVVASTASAIALAGGFVLGYSIGRGRYEELQKSINNLLRMRELYEADILQKNTEIAALNEKVISGNKELAIEIMESAGQLIRKLGAKPGDIMKWSKEKYERKKAQKEATDFALAQQRAHQPGNKIPTSDRIWDILNDRES